MARWKILVLASSSVIALAGCASSPRRPDGQIGPLPVGATAPEVVGLDVNRTEVRLTAQRGHPTVIYFYPKDGTPGCTKEACAFRDAWTRYKGANVAVIGVSSNSAERHQEFLRDKNLPFALASDESGTVAVSYGVGKGLFGFERITFLVDASGKVAHVWKDVDPGVHADEVLTTAKGLP